MTWTDRNATCGCSASSCPLPVHGWGAGDRDRLGIFWYLGPILILGLIPVLDLIAGLDRSNPLTTSSRPWKPTSTTAGSPTCSCLFSTRRSSGPAWLWSGDSLSVFDKVGLALTVGTVAGIGINTAHELGHKKEKVERWLAKIALAQSFYGHFYIEHNRGHHVRVATPEDPASSRVGETVYAFLPRTVVGSLKNAWRLEQPRFKRRDESHLSIRNDVLNAWLMSVVLWAALLVVFGIGILPYLLLQAAVGSCCSRS